MSPGSPLPPEPVRLWHDGCRVGGGGRWVPVPCPPRIVLGNCRCRHHLGTSVLTSLGGLLNLSGHNDGGCKYNGNHGPPECFLLCFVFDMALVSRLFVLFSGITFCIIFLPLVSLRQNVDLRHVKLCIPLCERRVRSMTAFVFLLSLDGNVVNVVNVVDFCRWCSLSW